MRPGDDRPGDRRCGDDRPANGSRGDDRSGRGDGGRPGAGTTDSGRVDANALRQTLTRLRRAFYEDPAGTLAEAVRCYEIARSLADDALCAQARLVQGAVSLHRGDLRGTLELLMDAESHAERSDDVAVRAEAAALKAQLSFFTGSYGEAIRHAEAAVRLADETDDLELRIHVRRGTCIVFGNVGVPDIRERIDELLELTITAGDRWEEAISRNDLACHLQELGELEAAEDEIGRALEVGHLIDGEKRFALGIILSTRSDIRLLAGRPEDALADAERALTLVKATPDPNPYVLGVTVRAEVQARMALGQLDDARRSGESALSRLGDSVPQTRSLILSTLATALRDAGRVEEAYDALARAAELERQALRELSALQRRLERATLETNAARRESDALAASHRELAQAHAELEDRAGQLQRLQDQLRDQAERDWLTGLHNRRFLARELDRMKHDQLPVPVSLAVLDLDNFKSINDGFGHATGDHVLVRVAGLLCDVLREADVIIRSGGEEFLVLMPETDLGAATACCERIRAAIRAEGWDQIAAGVSLTASVGVASTLDAADLEAVLKLADERLYAAKRAGRDRVVSGPGELAHT